MSSSHTTSASDPKDAEIARLREALRGAVMAWDTLYAKTTLDQFPFAEDLEFGPMLRARGVYDQNWYENRAFTSAVLDDGHEYKGDTHSVDCVCELCGAGVAEHVDQQHYCEDCKQTHWGDHNHCYLAYLSDDEVNRG